MGVCIRVPGPPPPLSITLPGGIKLQSQTNSTQQIPNILDPVQSLFQQAAPVFGAIQPVFDIVNFAMAVIMFLLTLLGMLAAIMMLLGNPALAMLFPPPTIINTADDTPIPGFLSGEDTGVPDPTKLIEDALAVFLKGLKLVGLIPQLSMMVTVKDTLNGAMAVMSGVIGKINALNDRLSMIPPDTGDPVVDQELACAREAVQDALAHAMGPLSNLVPVMQTVSTLAQPLNEGLPKPVINFVSIAVNLGLIPFPDDTAKAQFLGVLEQLGNGTFIDFPDFTDTSNLPATMDEMRAKLGPILGPLEAVQTLLTKLQSA